MPLLKVGKHHINIERIVQVLAPTTVGAQRDGAKIVLDGGEDLTVFGEEAAIVRQWLAQQTEKPDTLPITTKVETPRSLAKK